MSRPSVCIAIPSIPPRANLLRRCIESISAQTVPVEAVAVAIDNHREGAWTTRNRAMAMSRSEWTLFVDDDDELDPGCVEHLLQQAEEHGSEVTWGWFRVSGGQDPFPQHRGLQWDPVDWFVVPIVYMARTELLHAAAEKCGGFLPDDSLTGAWHVQDGVLFRTMYELSGGKFHASAETVWTWHHDSFNTSGLPTRY